MTMHTEIEHVEIPEVPSMDFKGISLVLLVGVVAGISCLAGMLS
jgi:hypothetical protein